MKRKRKQRWIAMLLAVAMLSSTMESTGLMQVLAAETEMSGNMEIVNDKDLMSVLPEDVKTWGDAEQKLMQMTGLLSEDGANLKLQDDEERYRDILIEQGICSAEDLSEKSTDKITQDDWTQLTAKIWETIVKTSEDADALRVSDEKSQILVAAPDVCLTGIEAGNITSVGKDKIELYDTSLKRLSICDTSIVKLAGVEMERLCIDVQDGEMVSLQSDSETKIPEVIITGKGTVTIEGNGSFGIIRIQDQMQQLTVRATCSVLNEAQGDIALEEPDGNSEKLQPTEQKELVLSGYLIRFIADGEVLDTEIVNPGTTVKFPSDVPEKEGYLFTSWYKDEDYTESAGQFEIAEGQTNYYARYTAKEDAVTVQFDTKGGTELSPVTMAKGENLLTRSIDEIYTSKEGYTFGGWCLDEECTEGFAYSQPVEENLTLYAFFTSDEVQSEEKEGNAAEVKDFDWNGKIAITAPEGMTAEEVKEAITITAGTRENDPEIEITKEKDGFVLSGAGYEQDGERGFEPGSTFTLTTDGEVYFSDYKEEITTLVISVFKEQVETVAFADDMKYVLWDDVISYIPAKEAEGNDLTEEASDLMQEDEQEETQTETVSEAEPETETESEIATEEAAAETESNSEWEMPAYVPGEIVVRGAEDYKEGDLVAFYDGEIGRDEKTMDSYTEGSYDGYVLYAKVQETKKTDEGTQITFEYASPEEYLSDFDVHMTEDANLEQELSQEDLAMLSSRLSKQIEENDELKAQMLVSVMSSKETQELLNEKYGDGVYSLAAMKATLLLNKPSITLSASGSEVTADISVSATATIYQNRRVLLTIEPKLSFTQILDVKMNVDGGKFWIDMSVSFRSTTKIALTISATSGGDVSVFEDAKETLEELVKPEGIEGTYEEYDQSVQDLMDTMNSIVETSLDYNDLFNILLLKLQYSFYGIITISFEVRLVGQIGVLATFGVEIIAKSGERIGFNYNFLKFKGSSYTEKLDSSVTNNIYLIGKVGVRVGTRMILSITICGIVKTSIIGELFVYAELSGIFFFTANLLSGANTNIGAVKFEVGIDVIVTLALQVNLLIKTVRKSWTVYEGRWPLWSKAISSKLSYMNEEEMDAMWEIQTRRANSRNTFGFSAIPMKSWDLINGKCLNNQLISKNNSNITLSIENLVVNDELVPEGDPKNGLFTVGDIQKGQNPFSIYMDENVAAEQVCEKAELDLVITYENHASSALVKKQVKKLHLSKKCALAATTHKIKIALSDWCADQWGIPAADWNNAVIYETSFISAHLMGGAYEPTATGTLSLGEIITKAQSEYPELASLDYSWTEPLRDASTSVKQYSVPHVSDFCYMTPENGVVRYDVRSQTDEYEVTYYLYVRRFEGYEDEVRYHVRLTGADPEDSYEFSTQASENGEKLTFTKEQDESYLLTVPRSQFDTSEQSLMMSINGQEAFKTGFVITGQETQADVYFDIAAGNAMLGIQLGEGVDGYEFVDPSIMTEDGIKPGTSVELNVQLKEGYGGLETICDNKNIDITTEQNRVRFTMPAGGISVTLQAYRLHSITYKYHYKGYGTYDKVYFAENENTEKTADPKIEGLTFRGWYTSPKYQGEAYQFGEKLTTDITLYADWTCDVTVHFSPAKGRAAYIGEDGKEHTLFKNAEKTYTVFTYSSQRPGEKLLDLLIPEYEGYQFMDWYQNAKFDGKAIDSETYKLTGGLDIYARWSRILTISFDRNDGSSDSLYEELTGYSGYPLPVLPGVPERKYYTFTGWYRDQLATNLFDIEKEILNWDTYLYAGWKANTYTISYELGGGKNDAFNPESYTTEDTVKLAQPEREGYLFKGWTGTGLNEITKNVIIPKGSGDNRTYTAVWEPIRYQISYKRTYGTATENPTEYTVESPDIILKQPTREKYEFKGWTAEGQDEPELEVRIPKGSMGNRSYTANWTTSDPILSILDRVQELASTPYTDDLTTYLQADDFMTDNRDYERIEKQLSVNMQKYLTELVAKDDAIAAYADQIQITIAPAAKTVDRNNTEKQLYTFLVTASYTDDDGNVTYSDPKSFEYMAELNKLTPTQLAVSSTMLKYGQPVRESSLTNGYAQYVNKELYTEYPISGTFTWANEEKDKIPFGRNNGTEASQYTAVFTPEDTAADMFAPANCKVDVVTQVALYVTGTAKDRVYRFDPDKNAADVNCEGSAKLVYATEDGSEGTDEFAEILDLLNPGTWTLDNGNIGARTAIYTGFSLNAEKNQNETFYLMNAEVKRPVEISVQNQVIKAESVQTEENSYVYDSNRKLENIALKTSGVYYEDAYASDGVLVSGTCTWKEETDKKAVPNAGTTSYKVKFTPDPKYQGGYGEYTDGDYCAKVIVSKQAVEVPNVEDKIYNGTNQKSGLSDTDLYTVKSDHGGTNVSDKPSVTLNLKNPENYVWVTKNMDGSITEHGSTEYQISYKITKAKTEIQKTNASVIDLQYGQKLNATKTVTNKQIQTELAAETMLKGYGAAYLDSNGTLKAVQGTWNWVVEGTGNVVDENQQSLKQPLDVKVDEKGGILSYNVKAKFTPKDSTNLEGFEAYLPVKVIKSQLNVTGSPSVTPIYEPKSSDKYTAHEYGNSVGKNSTINTNDTVVTNKYTGATVAGTWEWANADMIPIRSGNSNVWTSVGIIFKPTSEKEKNNYIFPEKTCDLEILSNLRYDYDVIYKGNQTVTKKNAIFYAEQVKEGMTFEIPIEWKKNSTTWYIRAVSINWLYEDGSGSQKKRESIAWCEKADGTIQYEKNNFIKVEKKGDKIAITMQGKTIPTNKTTISITLYEESMFDREFGRKRAARIQQTLTEQPFTESDSDMTETAASESETKEPETEAPEPTPPETETFQTEPPQTEPPQTEAPQTEAPQTEPPQTEAPQTEPPQTEAPQTETTPQTEPETQAAEVQKVETESSES